MFILVLCHSVIEEGMYLIMSFFFKNNLLKINIHLQVLKEARTTTLYIIHFTYQRDLPLPVFDICIDAFSVVCYPELQSQTLLQRRRKQKCWLPSVHLQFKQTRTTLAICTLRQFQTDMFNIRPASQWE